MPAIGKARIAILATNGFEQSELEVPRRKLMDAGATVEVVSLQEGEITGWERKDWGRSVKVDRTLGSARPSDYDALVLPGGVINPDLLRVEQAAIGFIQQFHETGKPVAAVCHAPWLLVEAGLITGRRATSYRSIRTDVINAGAKWEDSSVVRDGNIITSRQPSDLDAFTAAVIEAVEGTGSTHRSAAE